MTDADLIAKKLAFVETCVRELQELCRPERIEDDVREERFAAHTLQVAVQATLDIASHIVSDQRLGEPRTNRELFDRLRRGGWLSSELSETMYKMAGFRNVVVHGYQNLDPRILRNIVEHKLPDLLAFAEHIRARL